MIANLPRGPVMLGVEGTTLTSADRERLSHPLVGGVILFARNYDARMQLRALTAEIHDLRSPPLLIAVDHEGGRVQRFRDDFTAIAPMRALGERYDSDRAGALQQAEAIGRLIADELSACGVDFSFAPVLDIDAGVSAVIGDRAFHSDPHAVAELAAVFCSGLHEGGMSTVGKHFPGHGYVAADSHVDLPVDRRTFDDIQKKDLVPFAALAQRRLLDGVMPAHVVYPAIDAHPAGFSRFWLQDILRGRLQFDGLIFSDDLEMVGAQGAGDIVDRANAALAAGCDMVLACNDFAAMDDLLSRLLAQPSAELADRLQRMAFSPV